MNSAASRPVERKTRKTCHTPGVRDISTGRTKPRSVSAPSQRLPNVSKFDHFMQKPCAQSAKHICALTRTRASLHSITWQTHAANHSGGEQGSTRPCFLMEDGNNLSPVSPGRHCAEVRCYGNRLTEFNLLTLTSKRRCLCLLWGMCQWNMTPYSHVCPQRRADQHNKQVFLYTCC